MAIQLRYGWPEDGALIDNAPPKEGEGILAGMFVKYDAAGEMIKAVGADNEDAFVAMQNQASGSVEKSNSLPFVTRNFDYYTDQFVVGAYNNGDRLRVSGTASFEGKAEIHSGTAPVIGRFYGYKTFDGVEYMRILLEK